MRVYALQSIVFRGPSEAGGRVSLSRPGVANVGRMEKSPTDGTCVVVQSDANPTGENWTADRHHDRSRQWVSTRTAIPGNPTGHHRQRGVGVSWNVEAVPRLSTKGTRRGLGARIQKISVDTFPIAEGSTLGKRWEAGPVKGTVGIQRAPVFDSDSPWVLEVRNRVASGIHKGGPLSNMG
ncbi:MAG: hypothetical protein CM15mP78_08700 [Candidatus Poseidoniales archaeon]|nr:MAG: hypothetical protein CM15mP78_08700 [Candidatus Poseidoniales archaeon]